MYQSGEIGDFWKQNTFKRYKMAAQQGCVEVQFEVGKVYLLD